MVQEKRGEAYLHHGSLHASEIGGTMQYHPWEFERVALLQDSALTRTPTSTRGI
jgi:hypothetical protein